jgi:hypothetical protein
MPDPAPAREAARAALDRKTDLAVILEDALIVLGILLDAWPDPVSRPELAERSGYSETSLRNPLGRLRTLALVHDWTADDMLAQEARRGAPLTS